MIDFKELIELFILRTLPCIKNEKEIPNINFIFDTNSIELFNYVMKHPFRKKDVWTEDISTADLEITKEVNNMNPNSNTIIIDDGVLFFDYLVSIVNEHLKLFKEYDYTLMNYKYLCHQIYKSVNNSYGKSRLHIQFGAA